MHFSELLQGNTDLFQWILPPPFLPENGENISLAGFQIEPDIIFPELSKQLGTYIQYQISHSGKLFGYGGYLENRKMYQVSQLFQGDEPRSIHLGIDFWAPAGTEIIMPYNGLVHSFGDNYAAGDYGAVIITEHRLDGHVFFMLFGHLSRNSLKNIWKGKKLTAGIPLADLGDFSENGNWPAHLHFQLISNMDGYEGDFPGVVRNSEAGKWKEICPDPGIIFKL